MKTYKYKLYQHKRTRHLHRQIEVGADVWNGCIERHRAYYEETGKYLNKYTLQKEITQVKKDRPVPCPYCRPEDYRRAVERLLRNKK